MAGLTSFVTTLDPETGRKLGALLEGLGYEFREVAHARFAEQFKDAPDLVESVEVDDLPESFRVKLTDQDRTGDVVTAVGSMPGVDEAVDQRKLLGTFIKVVGSLQAVALHHGEPATAAG